MSLIVEFVGPPCSGKSVLCSRVADELQGHGIVVDPVFGSDSGMGAVRMQGRRLRFLLHHLLVRPVPTLRWVRMVLRSKQRSWNDFRAVLLNAVYKAESVRRCAGRDGVLLFDEGPFHAIWGIGYSGNRFRSPGSAELECLLDIPRGSRHVVIVVDVERREVVRRLAGRSATSRVQRDLDREGEAAVERAIQRYSELLPAMHEYVEGRQDACILHVGNNAPPEEAAREVVDRIRSMVSEPGGDG